MVVLKRDGSTEEFDLGRIRSAIKKAFESCDRKYTEDIVDFLTLKVTSDFQKKIKRNKISVEDVQNSVESVLIRSDYEDVAKSYILYRKQREKIREADKSLIDYKKIVDSYVNVADWRVKENSTVSYSVGGLILSNSGAITANYWLSEIYDKEIADAHRNADIHIHDLSMLTGYCFTGDTRIKTLDGKNPTLKELAESGDHEFWIFAYDHEKGAIVPAKGTAARKTRTVNRLVEITLTDGSVIMATEDHPFMLRDGSYKRAADLRANTSLMPLYVSDQAKYCSINGVWYGGKSKGYLHRWVAESFLGRALEKTEVVHHINGDKHDNRPENLMVISDAEHRAHEIRKTMLSEKWKTENARRLCVYNRSLEKRESVSAFAQHRQRATNGTFTPFAYVESVDLRHTAYNHCVRKVRVVDVEPTDVYDITVPGYNNFALDAGVFVHNCAGWSLKQLIKEGLGGVVGKITSSPASHLSTLCNQMVNFLGILQNEWAGAQAFSSFDTYLAPFVKVDNLSYKEVKQCIQSFIYGVNTPSRWGTQAPFTNITLDWTVPDDLAELNCIVGGKELDFRYKDCKKEMDMINKAFIELMIEGDANGRGFQYPIPTYSITKDFDWGETENNKLLFEMTAKYGTPYFSNYVNSDMEPSDIRSMCCRLRLDLRELRKKSGGFFGSGENTGSIGVVTINMPRIAYLSKDEKDFYERLDHLMDLSAKSLKIKRDVITKLLEQGLYPYTKRYLGTFNNHFSTIGLVGMNEAGLNASWLQKDLTHKETQEFAKNVLNHMRERLSDYQEQYGDLYNLEATPAESTAFRLAKHDIEKYPDIITARKSCDDAPYYTNSSHLPVGYTDDVFSALDIQDDLQTLYTSGTVFHAFLGEKLPDWKAAMTLVRKIAENYKLPYYTLSPTYSVCTEHGYLSGEQSKCPVCGKPTEVYSRITGYYRPVQNWNDGKAQEFKDRLTYNIGNSHLNRTTYKEVEPDETVKQGVCSECSIEEDVHYYLVTTKTCPNCKAIKAILDKDNIPYKNIYVDENLDFVEEHGIKMAPTLVDLTTNKTYSGVSDIKKYLEI